jgi:hypothetical protein
MNELFHVGRAQTDFIWKPVDLYERRSDRRNSAFMGGSCTQKIMITLRTWDLG